MNIMKRDALITVLGIIGTLYFIISQIMSVIFFVGYCRSDDSMLKIIIVDPILAELKGLLWVFFI